MFFYFASSSQHFFHFSSFFLIFVCISTLILMSTGIVTSWNITKPIINIYGFTLNFILSLSCISWYGSMCEWMKFAIWFYLCKIWHFHRASIFYFIFLFLLLLNTFAIGKVLYLWFVAIFYFASTKYKHSFVSAIISKCEVNISCVHKIYGIFIKLQQFMQ